MRRFPIHTRFPDTYNPGKQSDVPGHDIPTPPPYDPSLQPDLKKLPPPLELDLSVVRYVMDSRPTFAWDFFWQESQQASESNLPPINPGGTNQPGYNVPQGYNLLLRKVVVSLGWTAGIGTSAADIGPILFTGDADYNFLLAAPSLQLLVNGAAATGWTPATASWSGLPYNVAGGIPLPTLWLDDYECPCFVPIEGGANVRARLNFPAHIETANNYIATFSYYGTMLFSTGRVLARETGNADPDPVQNFGTALGNYRVGGQ